MYSVSGWGLGPPPHFCFKRINFNSPFTHSIIVWSRGLQGIFVDCLIPYCEKNLESTQDVCVGTLSVLLGFFWFGHYGNAF
jgi:hypothetical protein